MGNQKFDAVVAKYFQPTPMASGKKPTNGLYMDSLGNISIAVAGVTIASFAKPGGASVNTPRTVHTGNTPVKASTDGTDTTPVVTETYIAEVTLGAQLVTGFALFNGSAVAGNVVVALYNKAGAVVANSLLAGTAQSGTDAFQRVAFTATYQAVPGTYYVGLQFDNTSARLNTHPIGNFGASKKTGEVFGTLTTITPPTTFTAGQGPMGTFY